MSRFAGTYHRASERGTVLLMATVTILIVVGMLALAVDVGYLMSGRGQLQNIVDAAALASSQGLRIAIEPVGSKTEQEVVVRKLARDFALFNPMRRADGTSGLALSDDDIVIDYPANYPVQPARVIVKHRLALPTIFGNVFGISSMNVGAVAIAGTTIVDGGTGFVSGCWRPILIPDTFFDKDNRVWAICDPNANFPDGGQPCRSIKEIDPIQLQNNPSLNAFPWLALQDQDYYVSRFASQKAGSLRGPNTEFMQERLKVGQDFTIIPNQPSHVSETSIRDAYNEGELKIKGGKNLMGQRMSLRQQDWRIVDFTGSGIVGNFPTDPVQQINKGCCAPIQVGKRVYVYPDPLDKDIGVYQNFVQQLLAYHNAAPQGLVTLSSRQYRYAQTQNFPTPNANPQVIPVLMCSPLQYSNTLTGNDQFYITNVGAFYLEAVNGDGSLIGYFVREVVTGGIPLQPQNEVANSGLLPISVHLVR